MKSRLGKELIKYAIAIAVGGLMVFSTLSLHGYANALPDLERYRMLADAFTIPGVFLMLLAALVWIANEGLFRGLGYVGSWLVRTLIPFAARKNGDEKYYDYVKRKEAQGKIGGYSFIFFTGAAFMIVAIVFIVLFYRIY